MISHLYVVLGWEQVSADALSCALVSIINTEDIELNNVDENYAICSVKALPATGNILLEIINNRKITLFLSQVRDYVDNGWPENVP